MEYLVPDQCITRDAILDFLQGQGFSSRVHAALHHGLRVDAHLARRDDSLLSALSPLEESVVREARQQERMVAELRTLARGRR